MKRLLSAASLFLIEQVAAVLIFIACAAVCTGVFVRAWQMTRDSADLTYASAAARSAAEAFYAAPDMEALATLLDAQVSGEALAVTDEGYTLRLSRRTEQGLLWADISVLTSDGDEVYTLSAAKAR